jgi:predicted hydrocarbon binding protein
VLIEVKGSPQKIRFVARMIAQYLVKNSPEQAPLEITSVFNLDGGIRVELSKSNKKEGYDSLITSFGGLNEVILAIKSRPDFWKSIINGHLLSNYNMVTVHRNYFEDLLSGKVPMGEITIETLAKKPIQEIPLKEMLSLIKEVYETSRVVDRVEVDRENLILFHNYRNKEVIDKLKTSIVSLLEANGHLYDAKSTANMVVLTHRPDVGIRINEIVSNLKISNSRVDQDLIMFMAFLKGLKNIPDIPVSLTALGKRIGVSLMEEYEKENNIKSWEFQNFQKALEIIDSKLHRESEWKANGKNLLYTITKCNIVAEGNTVDKYICHTIRETFKGAVNHAFGNRAQLDIKKLLSHGDDCCEVLIRVP